MRPKLPTLRASLLGLHRALLRVEDARWAVDDVPILSEFEKLVLLLEDRRFLNHIGFDVMSILRETFRWIGGKRHGGASTIDMQLFRTVSDRYERTLRRKVRELIGVLALQRKFSKIEILRIYLEIAYFGTGLLGAKQGASALFPDLLEDDTQRIDLSRLSLDQAAQLAALLVYPKPRVPNANWSAKVRRRANYGLWLYARREKKFDQILR